MTSQELVLLVEIAKKAGNLILEVAPRCQKGGAGVQYKSDRSPVTEADILADQWVRAELMKLTPRIPIISEESPVPEYSIRKSWSTFWLVDALDGTKEFISGGEDYTVNIALIRDGIPVVGVIYCPRKRQSYFAMENYGAWKQAQNQEPLRIYSKRIDPHEKWTMVESKSHPSLELEEWVNRHPIGKRIRVGSSLKFCFLAEGLAHVYPRFGRMMEWDVAAGDCIYRNSGQNDVRQSPFIYNQPDLAITHFVLGL